ncbi:MAG: putative peptidoglycan glycosyltransferase FtsW [Bacillota bacterium]|nr:putative peptidoglycan glycosyltransferase FtsW [Bacillota bacterium]
MAKKKRVKRISTIGQMDINILSIITIMVLFGLIMVGSASSVSALYTKGDSMFFLRKQLLVALAGFVLMYIISRVDYHIVASPAIILISYITVWIAMVLAAFIGGSINGANRWINILGFSIQPSEPAKIVLIILTAWFCSKQSKESLKSFNGGFVSYGVILVLSVIPLLLEKHKSASVIFAILIFTIALLGGANIKYYLIMAPMGLGGALIWFLHDEYSRKRLLSMFDPFLDPKNTGYQAIQSLYAIGSGGLFGLGLGRSQQKIMYIPEPQNDFIFSIICEELGFIGAVSVILLFMFFMFRCVKIASEAPDKLGRLVAMGLTTLIMAQFVLNIVVVTAMGPVTGVPLPFFSAGGTNLLFTLSGMGILLNISRQSIKLRKNANQQQSEVR